MEFVSKVQLTEAYILSFVRWSDDTLIFFSENSRMYLYDWNKKKMTQDIYIREKVDYYCIDQFGDVENKILDGEYRITSAYCSGSLC